MKIIDQIKDAIKYRNKPARTERCIVVGSKGEVGSTLMRILANAGFDAIGIDKDGVEQKYVERQSNFVNADIMHICIPYTDKKQFDEAVRKHIVSWKPVNVIIHSTVMPGTTKSFCDKTGWDNNPRTEKRYIPYFAYSPCRGQHENLYDDFMRYTKFVASDFGCREIVESHFKNMGLKVSGCDAKMFHWLELAKLLDTSQYGILIMYAQIANRIAEENGVSYEFVRDFMSETNEFYHNRPDIRPGYVGGKCVRQNIELLQKVSKHELWLVFKESNELEKKNEGSR